MPRLVIAAPASGSGKTTVATGLMAAYAGRGLTVSPHKVGPDYIDPGYHALAAGRPGRNLDAYLCGPERIAPLFLHGAAGADLAVVEGVMGLYDGAAGQGELASTAQVAKVLRAPVVLVVDASSQSRSVAALVHGFASWDPEVRLAGVILNKLGSDRHEELLREALDASGVPVLGALRRSPDAGTPSRHLGLVPAAERRAEAVASVAALAERVRAGCDLDALFALARSAPPVPGPVWDPAAEAGTGELRAGRVPVTGSAAHGTLPGSPGSPVSPVPAGSPGAVPPGAEAERPGDRLAHRPAAPEPDPPGHGTGARRAGSRSGPQARPGSAASAPAGPDAPAPDSRDRPGRPVIAVAGGPAFTFSYAEHAELLTAAGAEVVTVDPLRDEKLPPGTAGLVVGGGFPEMYAPELSANEPLREAVAALAARGAPVAAECAGLLYLARSLDGRPMCGVLDAEARMTERLTLGYREAVALSDSALAPVGARLRGHEFHRTVIEPGAGTAPAWGLHRPSRRVEGFVQGGLHASYVHLHWAGAPGTARRFVGRCAG
ncbi:cobyrinate a,c-diamide synthase [Streptomyces sp. F63]|uniref:cobyrinate a,c-diamide synthase n=1 Tax=Streptomyces sp. F63 TaxID=2824887 RepID=UPI001B35B5DE|nr:cobyrinate a,c-diamide synthase [Streptomyces sp. F63]MBQ0986689.1 cobyrinate a,c-diamide synthase [Streptomyces sp. F63]